jgi:hypothetical protein
VGGATGAGGSAGAGGSSPGAGGVTNPVPDAGPSCVAAIETSCTDSKDDDCDGYIDCRDSDCEGKTCGEGGKFTCTGGACIAPGNGLPPLPRIDNVRVTQRGDTAIVEFEPIDGALDYRIYPMPAPGDVLVGTSGEVVVKNAIYRCGGDRPFRAREKDPATLFDASLSGAANTIHDYARVESAALLGYVYLTPAPGRQPVYRMSDPNGGGGFQNADWVVPLYGEANRADYVKGTAERDRLLAADYRDDGIAFYVPNNDTRPVN